MRTPSRYPIHKMLVKNSPDMIPTYQEEMQKKDFTEYKPCKKCGCRLNYMNVDIGYCEPCKKTRREDLKQRSCMTCGETFTPRKKGDLKCAKCKKEWNKNKIVCHCGEEFLPYRCTNCEKGTARKKGLLIKKEDRQIFAKDLSAECYSCHYKKEHNK